MSSEQTKRSRRLPPTPSSATCAYSYVESPLGPLLLAGDAADLHLISFPKGKQVRTPDPGWRRDDALFASAAAQLRDYFDGTLERFDLSLRTAGTAFQTAVWTALRKIPLGQTISYADLARRVGKPTAVRAVGTANGANPLPIVIPCHRVIGSNGSLTGFGGGLDAKRFLLDHEGALTGTTMLPDP